MSSVQRTFDVGELEHDHDRLDLEHGRVNLVLSLDTLECLVLLSRRACVGVLNESGKEAACAVVSNEFKSAVVVGRSKTAPLPAKGA